MKTKKIFVLSRQVLRIVLHFLFPKTCLNCNCDLKVNRRSSLCKQCFKKLMDSPTFICKRCGKVLENGAHCYNCRGSKADKYKCSLIRSAFVFNASSRSFVHALKYHHLTYVAKEMGRLMAQQFYKYPELNSVQLVLPVPLFKKKQKARGYNQSELLVREFCKYARLPFCMDVLKRVKNTVSQTTLGREERIQNMQDAFACINPAIIKDKRILLVDDVATTGATLENCAIALKQAGAKSVFAYTFARE